MVDPSGPQPNRLGVHQVSQINFESQTTTLDDGGAQNVGPQAPGHYVFSDMSSFRMFLSDGRAHVHYKQGARVVNT